MVKPGRDAEGEPADEVDHFEVCPECGQAFDRRDLELVMHHYQPGHKPIPDDS